MMPQLYVTVVWIIIEAIPNDGHYGIAMLYKSNFIIMLQKKMFATYLFIFYFFLFFFSFPNRLPRPRYWRMKMPLGMDDPLGQ